MLCYDSCMVFTALVKCIYLSNQKTIYTNIYIELCGVHDTTHAHSRYKYIEYKYMTVSPTIGISMREEVHGFLCLFAINCFPPYFVSIVSRRRPIMSKNADFINYFCLFASLSHRLCVWACVCSGNWSWRWKFKKLTTFCKWYIAIWYFLIFVWINVIAYR